PYNIKDLHSKMGIAISLLFALIFIFFTRDPFKGLVYSQMMLSIQLPFTVFIQLYLTSSRRVMGKYANSWYTFYTILSIGLIITYLNFRLLFDWLLG
ncbi:MAG TPA: divalent metal cation transporter, partial [Syntrophorhabdaceae bacterium]|nr:divalent metal cation transporter [Syntrophorhabdaceae bacterium]